MRFFSLIHLVLLLGAEAEESQKKNTTWRTFLVLVHSVDVWCDKGMINPFGLCTSLRTLKQAGGSRFIMQQKQHSKHSSSTSPPPPQEKLDSLEGTMCSTLIRDAGCRTSDKSTSRKTRKFLEPKMGWTSAVMTQQSASQKKCISSTRSSSKVQKESCMDGGKTHYVAASQGTV
jgi:hypothetical protein